MSYFEFLLLVHIAGAIIGFGPTFTFAISGPLASTLGGPAAGGVLRSMTVIQRRLVLPVAIVVQPLTGVLLIFESGRNEDFFTFEWLWISILIYIGMFYTAVFVQTPVLGKMTQLGAKGEADTPQFAALAKRARTAGPFLTVALIVIIVLMVLKPGE